MTHIAHQWIMGTRWNLSLRINLFIAPRRSRKTKTNFVTLVTGVEPTSWCLLTSWFMTQIFFFFIFFFLFCQVQSRLITAKVWRSEGGSLAGLVWLQLYCTALYGLCDTALHCIHPGFFTAHSTLHCTAHIQGALLHTAHCTALHSLHTPPHCTEQTTPHYA